MRSIMKYDIGGLLVRAGGRFAQWSRWCHRTGYRMQAEVIHHTGRTH